MSTIENSVSATENKFAFQMNVIDGLLGKLRGFFTAETCKAHMAVFRAVGHGATLLAGAVGLLFSVVGAIKSDSLMLFLLGVGWLVGMVIIDYVSRRFDQTSDRLVASTKSYLSATVYVDAIALIMLVGSVGIFAAAVYGTIKGGSIGFFAKAGGLSVWLFYVSLITMNAASMLNVEFKPGLKAEEEGVGLLEFNAKSCLLAVPFYFGAGLALALINIVWNVIQASQEADSLGSVLLDSMPQFGVIALFAALPVLACVAFLVCYGFIAAVKSLIRIASLLEKREG